MLGNINTEVARDAWTMVPGRSTELTYDENGNCIIIVYKEGGKVVFTRYFTYKANNKCIKIECQ